MHHPLQVWIPTDKAVKTQIKEALKPWKQTRNNEENGIWTWYEIGGRWDWVYEPNNICPVAEVPRDIHCWAILIRGRLTIDNAETGLKTLLNRRKIKTGFMVAVDIHEDL